MTAASVMTSGASAQDAERGERLLNARCTSCHNPRTIQTQALDAEGWTKRLDAEAARGAALAGDERAVLLEYLVINHGPLPDGAGKSIVLNTCTLCHDLGRVRSNRATAEEWARTLQSMLNEGAPLSDDELPIVLRYLAANFRP